jgi:L-asparaginase II
LTGEHDTEVVGAARPGSAGERRPPAAAPLLAVVTRRDVRTGRQHLESAHAAHLVIAGADGEVVASCGDPDHPTFIRSTAKPFQATACLEILEETAGPSQLPDDDELAVAWASHRGEPGHLEAVSRILQRAGTAADELTCPPAVPEAAPGAPPSRLRHNCSGKHALFALAGRGLGVGGPALLDPEAALQRRVLGVLERELGAPVAIGVDGCGAPAVAVPLQRLAVGFAGLAVADRFRRVRQSGLVHPGLVGGEGRLETALLAVGVVAKVGAEGVYGVGWVAHDGRPWGLAIKSVDGAARGAAAVVAEILTVTGVVPSGTWMPPPPLGGGVPAGQIRATDGIAEVTATLAHIGVGRGSR